MDYSNLIKYRNLTDTEIKVLKNFEKQVKESKNKNK